MNLPLGLDDHPNFRVNGFPETQFVFSHCGNRNSTEFGRCHPSIVQLGQSSRQFVGQLHHVPMNPLLLNLLKTFSLLAVFMLPVEQALAAICCCQGGQRVGMQHGSSSLNSCCAKGRANCCSMGSPVEFAFCADADQDSGSKPCQCPAGCSGKTIPLGVDPATDQSSQDDLSPVTVVCESTLGVLVSTDSDRLARAASHTGTCGFDRCVLLCCFLL